MSVVEDMATEMDDEPDPTWDEAVAAFEAATPVELVRKPRSITIVYRYADNSFTATSPELTGFKVSGRSRREAQELVRRDLAGFLDLAVKVIEHFPAPEPSIETAASCCGFILSSPPVVRVTSSGAGRAFVSSARPSARRVPA